VKAERNHLLRDVSSGFFCVNSRSAKKTAEQECGKAEPTPVKNHSPEEDTGINRQLRRSRPSPVHRFKTA
jgi:hypothetical protein